VSLTYAFLNSIEVHGFWETQDEWRISTVTSKRIEKTERCGHVAYHVRVSCDHEFFCYTPTLGMTVGELLRSPEERDLVTELSEAQELALISQPKNLVVTYLLVNDWKFREITEAFRMDENELVQILLRLDQLKIIDYRPPSRTEADRPQLCGGARTDGPVHTFFLTCHDGRARHPRRACRASRTCARPPGNYGRTQDGPSDIR
jgi:hypothetical protein